MGGQLDRQNPVWMAGLRGLDRGLVLGLALLNIFINNQVSEVLKCTPVKFADKAKFGGQQLTVLRTGMPSRRMRLSGNLWIQIRTNGKKQLFQQHRLGPGWLGSSSAEKDLGHLGVGEKDIKTLQQALLRASPRSLRLEHLPCKETLGIWACSAWSRDGFRHT